MANASAQDVKNTISAQVSQLDASVRSTLADLKENGSTTLADLRQKSDATMSELQQQGSTRIEQLSRPVRAKSAALWSRYVEFSKTSPGVSAFLTIQLLLAGFPLLVFTGFMLSVSLTTLFIAGCIITTFAFFAACVLLPVLTITSFIGISLFVFCAISFLGLQWLQAVRRQGLRSGTKTFLFGVQREIQREADAGKAYALRAEDRVSEHTGKTKLEDVVPAAA